jgi:hypothetical protein
MPLQRRRLLESGDDTFNANGIATVRLGPQVSGDSWIITRVNVASDSVLATTGTLYLNAVNRVNQIDTSASANADTSDSSDINLGPTEHVIFRWRGGTPGATATMTVYGIAER